MAAIDLHSHSTASDGALAPAELVSRAHAQAVRVLALTDHDTTAGLAEAAQAAAAAGAPPGAPRAAGGSAAARG